jgi:hypothetical protein
MWENAQLTNTEYRKHRKRLVAELGENPSKLRELADLDDRFKQLTNERRRVANTFRALHGLASSHNPSVGGALTEWWRNNRGKRFRTTKRPEQTPLPNISCSPRI